MISEEQKQKLAQYFSTQPVDVVYLFGSQATGKANRLSDIDFAILFQKRLDAAIRFDIKLKMMGDIGGVLKRDDVEIVDLEQAPLLFRYEAIAPRTIIYARDESRMREFEMDALKRYFDIRSTFFSMAQRKLALLVQKGFVYDRR